MVRTEPADLPAIVAKLRAKLVIEVDGGQPSPGTDAQPTAIIEADTDHVLHFRINDGLANRDHVARLIASRLRPPHPYPPPR